MLSSEIFPVSLDKKATVIRNTREEIIPRLIRNQYPAERVLRILHRSGTWYASSGSLEQNLLNETYIALYGSRGELPRHLPHLVQILEEIKSNPEIYHPCGSNLKGSYRILGRFAENPRLAEFAPETSQDFTGAIPVRSKDYQIENSPFYYPPVFNIDTVMSKIGQLFDHNFPEANSKEEIAEAISSFYFWGLAMVHPFIGGNHRGFDRFIEYAFAAKGIDILIPQNETLNIPNTDEFNTQIYSARREVLSTQGLSERQFNFTNWEGISQWLIYQHQLNERVFGNIESNADIKPIAQALLNWV